MTCTLHICADPAFTGCNINAIDIGIRMLEDAIIILTRVPVPGHEWGPGGGHVPSSIPLQHIITCIVYCTCSN